MKSVPVVDIAAARSGDESALTETARAVDAACIESGFFNVTGHGVPTDLVEQVLDVGRRFFALPMEEKQLVAPPGPEHYRGYLGPDTTSLAATLGDDASPPDLAESFNVSRWDDPDLRDRAYYPGADRTFLPNRWPARPAELRPVLEQYYAVMEELCFDMLPIFARAMELPPDWFDDKVQYHTALLVLNWYPPTGDDALPGQLRRGAHTDYEAFTLLAAEQIPGLQIHLNDEWVDVPLVPGGFVVNLGDLMARWTNDRWVATLHRVVIPEGEDRARDRMSVPFFFQPSYGTSIETIPTTITPDRPAKYDPVVSGTWITAKSTAMLDDQE